MPMLSYRARVSPLLLHPQRKAQYRHLLIEATSTRLHLLSLSSSSSSSRQKAKRRLRSFGTIPCCNKTVVSSYAATQSRLLCVHESHHLVTPCIATTSDSFMEAQLTEIQEKMTAFNNGRPLNLKSPRQLSAALYKNNTDSAASFGTSRRVLMNMANTGNEEQKVMAALILQYRELTKSRPVGNKNTGEFLMKETRASVKKVKGVTDKLTTKGSKKNWSVMSAPFSTSSDGQLGHRNAGTRQEGSNAKNDFEDEENSNPLVNNEGLSPKSLSKVPYQSSSSYVELVDSLFSATMSKETPLLMDVIWQEPLRLLTRPSARVLVSQLNPLLCPMGYDPLATPFDPYRCTRSTDDSSSAVTTTAGKRGSLLHFVREQKQKYYSSPTVILTRVGEFYEAYGIDAILLVEHCGLNPMAGKARAGCPFRNIQPTLDGLTLAGFRVAVYEEAAETDSRGARGAVKSRLKHRMFSQIVSTASPVYMYDLVLGDENNNNNGMDGAADATIASTPVARPYVGVVSTAAGYTIVEVFSEERSVRISERVTAEAVACRLAAFPPADPLFYVPSAGEETAVRMSLSKPLIFLPSRWDTSNEGPGSRLRVKILTPALLQNPNAGISDLERAKKCIVSALLELPDFCELRSAESLVAGNNDDVSERMQRRATHDDFAIVSSVDSPDYSRASAHPLYMETATQLGLISDPKIPSIVQYLLPETAPASARRFLRRWLLIPPPPYAVDAMAALVQTLKERGPSLPPLTVPSIGKVLALVRAGEASAQVYRELLVAMDAVISILDTYNHSNNPNGVNLVEPLMTLLRHESGMAADPTSLRQRCLDTMQDIEEVVNAHTHTRHSDIPPVVDQSSDYGHSIPASFLDRNESPWRGRVKVNAARAAYDNVEVAAHNLAQAVAADFWNNPNEAKLRHSPNSEKDSKGTIVQDIFNNLIALRKIPSWALRKRGEKAKYHHPHDRNGKVLRNRYTTSAVENALSDYVEACESASASVKAALAKLSAKLCEGGCLPTIVQASHANLILSTAAHHAANANLLGWHIATATDYDKDIAYKENSVAGHFVDVWPYWMDQSESVTNSFHLKGMILLTAPNMSGKSTLMRSTAAAALLTNCGLCAPLGSGSWVRRFDSIYVRGASADVPMEDKSAFGAEMSDVASLLRSGGNRSLVFVDELGRGTSPRDGASLAGAVLEKMSESGMSGIFATHLHEILNLPLRSTATGRIIKKRMAVKAATLNADKSTGIEWTYKLEGGVCTDSLALLTAAKFGIPKDILIRAETLSLSLVGSHHTHSAQAATVFAGSSFTATDPCEGIDNTSRLDFEYAIRLLEGIAGENRRVVHIPPEWTAPASLAGSSCVYILELCNSAPTNNGKEQRYQYYVGETDMLAQRLQQHRAKKGQAWSTMNAVALKVDGGKSASRNIESLLIRKMASSGFEMISTSDGRTIRPWNMQHLQ